MALSPQNNVGCLLTKRLTKGGSRAPQDPPSYAVIQGTKGGVNGAREPLNVYRGAWRPVVSLFGALTFFFNLKPGALIKCQYSMRSFAQGKNSQQDA